MVSVAVAVVVTTVAALAVASIEAVAAAAKEIYVLGCFFFGHKPVVLGFSGWLMPFQATYLI